MCVETDDSVADTARRTAQRHPSKILVQIVGGRGKSTCIKWSDAKVTPGAGYLPQQQIPKRQRDEASHMPQRHFQPRAHHHRHISPTKSLPSFLSYLSLLHTPPLSLTPIFVPFIHPLQLALCRQSLFSESLVTGTLILRNHPAAHLSPRQSAGPTSGLALTSSPGSSSAQNFCFVSPRLFNT